MSMTPFSERAERALGNLRQQIESLAARVEASDTPLNPAGNAHVVIANGFFKQEGMPAAEWRGLEQVCRDTLTLAEIARREVTGDAVLYWRTPPEIDCSGAQPKTYMRFSFMQNERE